jgi:hypothetical protein
VREVEQVVVVQPEQWALQHHGEREVVVRHEQHVGEGNEVHDRKLL